VLRTARLLHILQRTQVSTSPSQLTSSEEAFEAFRGPAGAVAAWVVVATPVAAFARGVGFVGGQGAGLETGTKVRSYRMNP
jgi:hypothetical protein